MKRILLFGLVVSLLLWAAVAQADNLLTVPGARGGGSTAYDRSFVQIFGPRKARNVLVLVPGAYGGAGQFSQIAPEIVRRVPGLQVWAWDRREQALIDDSGFLGNSADRATAYYLHGAKVAGHPFTPASAQAGSAASGWGLDLQLRDLRAVVRSAASGGRRRVMLGGEGLGGATALAYATWDFAGHAGWRDIKGLVLIDGALMSGSPAAPTVADADRQLASLASQGPFADPLASGSAARLGILAELEALYARQRPSAAAALTSEAGLPSSLRPPVRATNAALLGYDFDTASAPAVLAPLGVRSGTLAAQGDPRPWRDSANTPIAALGRLFGARHATEWYFPRRLAIDIAALDSLRVSATTRRLGLRAIHAREVAVPLYAFESDFRGGLVNAGARRFVRSSRVPRAVFVSAHGFSALDSLAATNGRNFFLRSVVPFLKQR